MSPSAALIALLLAVKGRDPDAILGHAEDLAAWLRRGGFTPLIIDPVLAVARREYDNTEDR